MSRNTRKPDLYAFVLAACLALSVAFLPGCSGEPSSTDSSQTSQSAQQAAEEPAQTGVLSLGLDIEGWESNSDGATVKIAGTSANSEKIERQVLVIPGTPKTLNLPAGSYDFSVDGASISTETVAYESASSHIDFAGEKDEAVTLKVPQDTEATQALAQKAEEEAAAKAQAEAEEAARAQAEAEAAAQAEAEAQAQAAAEAQAQAAAEVEAQRQAEAAAAAQANEQTVYITNTGEKYHRDGCRHLKKSKIPISLSDAQARGYTACKNCF